MNKLYKRDTKGKVRSWVTEVEDDQWRTVAGIHNGTPEYAKKMIDKGFNLVTVGSDSRYIATGAKSDIEKLKGKKREPESKSY